MVDEPPARYPASTQRLVGNDKACQNSKARQNPKGGSCQSPCKP